MWLCRVPAILAIGLCLPPALSVKGVQGHPNDDFAQACYGEPLPALEPSADNRTVPWDTTGIINGTSCCSSLDEVRAGIDALDAQILQFLSQRAAYVRQATRFKATREVVNVPSRDEQIIGRAVELAVGLHLPATVARGIFATILNASVAFELCVFDSLHDRGN